MSNITEYAMGTYLEHSGPWHVFRKARAMCSDGVVRTTIRMAIVADTFFSVPCAIGYWDKTAKKNRTIAGYITVQSAQGYDTCTDDDPAVVRFVAYTYRTNGHLLPEGMWKEIAA